MKRILIGSLIFLVYLALVIVLAIYGLHFTSTRLILFCVILGLLGALVTAFIVWYLHKSAGPGKPQGTEAINLNTLLRDANAKIKQASRKDAKSFAEMPLIYVIGDENSAKTQTVLQSGLDPELLAGNVQRDGMIVPTQSANIWLAGSSILIEAGGALLREPALWKRLVASTQPGRLGSAFSSQSRRPTRSVVVCVSIERFLAPYTSQDIQGLAQSLNERLREVSQTLGISLPVYVLFTKIDNIEPFADYAERLTEGEVKMPIGTLLSATGAGSGLYGEQAAAQVNARFDELLYALSEYRLDILSRGGELANLSRAYEFPRDLRKLRDRISAFLVEIARPSQLGVNPFLRGFFFTGMRAHIIDEFMDVNAVQQPIQAAAPSDASATRVFTLASLQQQQTPAAQPSRRGSTRKVPQWVFLPHLFSNIFLADKSALDTSRASTRVNFLKRALLLCLSGVVLLYLVMLTISFFNNKALEDRVKAGQKAIVSPASTTQFASPTDLTILANLGDVLNELDGYRKDGAPLMDRWGIYHGNALYPVACRAFSDKFRLLLLKPTQDNILGKLSSVSLDPAQVTDYNATYNPLKAYLITTFNPDKAKLAPEFLAPELVSKWNGDSGHPADYIQTTHTQFETYARLLADNSPCVAPAGASPSEVPDAVNHARVYLNSSKDFHHIYESMKAAANHKFPGFSFNSKYPEAKSNFDDPHMIEGAFTKPGFAFMQQAILNPDYFKGEEWVLGPQSGPTLDRASTQDQIHKTYIADYVGTWRTYMTTAHFIPYGKLSEAAVRLGTLDSSVSPVLKLFSLVSINTAVSEPQIANAFKSPQAVVPPTNPENTFAAPSNGKYIESLQTLAQAVKSLTDNPLASGDATAGTPIITAAISAEQAAANLRNSPSTPDTDSVVYSTSLTLLQDPIERAKSLAAQAPASAAGGAAKDFCSQSAQVFGKFPFNPDSKTDATPDEVAQIFSSQGTFIKYYNTSLNKLINQQGNRFVQANPAIAVNPGFLAFLDKAQLISTSLFPSGTQPQLTFSLTEDKVPGAPEAVLDVDGQQITGAGQKKQFHWVSKSDSKVKISAPQNERPDVTGPWSIFHFTYPTQHSPGQFKYKFQSNGQNDAIVTFETSDPGSALLDPGFMKSFHCSTSVSK